MTQQINATMSTSIALDLLSASESVKSLTSVVRSSQSAWKAQEAEMKSAGDMAGAAQVKYEGLGKSIEAQQSKIDALKAKQAELKGNTSETAQQFLKYGQQIDAASKQLASMQAQQDRAKTAMDYQKSGLAGLQDEYRKASQANQVYVERLQAEGKQQEANKAQINGYKSSISNLNEQLSKQSAELDKIASASGKDSDAYRTQQNRINETATSIAKAKSSMTGLQDEMNKANPSIFTRIKDAISSTNKQADKTPGLLRKIVSGDLISNAISSVWTTIQTQGKTVLQQGLQIAEAGEQAKRIWTSLGVSDSGADALINQMRELKSETNLSADQVDTLQKRFYGMTGSVQKTQELTTGVATLSDKLRLSGDAGTSMAKSLQRAFNSGKLTTGVLTRMENAAPGLGSALAQAAGMSEQAFNKMVSGGQMSSQKLQDLIVKIGGSSKTVFADFGNTAEGAEQRLKGAWQSIEAKMAKPLVSVQSTGINSVVNVLQSAAVQSLFTSAGEGIAKITQKASDLLNYVAQHQKDIGGIVTDLADIVKIAGSYVWDSFKGILKDVANWFGISGKNAQSMKNPLATIHDILDKIVQNKDGIKTAVNIIAGLWMTKKAIGFASSVGRVYTNLKNLADSKLFVKIASNFGLINKAESASDGAAPAISNVENTASKARLGSRVLKGTSNLAATGTAIDVGGSIVASLVSNNEQQKIAAASKATGSVIGGGIGAAVGSLIGPEGTAAGAKFGSAIGDALGSTKTAQTWAKDIQKSVDAASKGITMPAPKISADTKALGDSMAKYTKELSKKLVVSFSTDPKSMAKAKQSVDKTYADMSKSVDRYYANKEKASSKDLQTLVKEGVLTQKQADAQLTKEIKSDAAAAKAKKSTYATMAKDANTYYSQSEKIASGNTTKLLALAKKYGTNSKQYEDEKNKELLASYKSYANQYAKQQLTNNSKITSMVKSGASQQEKLLAAFNKRKNTMSLQQIESTAKNAKKEYDAAVRPAQQARDAIIKAADTRYKSTVAAATHEYKDTGSISKSQYDAIVSKARQQRDDTSSAAKDQYSNVTKHATNQYKSTVSAISKQKSEAITQQQLQDTGVSTEAASQSKKVVGHSTKQANSSLKAAHHQATGTNSIFSGLNSWWNKVVKFFGGSSAPTGSGDYGYTEIGGLAYSNGGAVKNGMALVGEAGPELQYQPWSGQYKLLGTNGPQLTNVANGDYILNARDTAKVLSGELGHVLPGYANGLGDLSGFFNGIKSTVSKVWDKVSKSVKGILKKIGNPLKFFTGLADRIFDVNSVHGAGSLARQTSKSMRDQDVNGIASLFSKLKSSAKEMEASSVAGQPKQAQAWLPIVEKLMQQMGANPPNGISSEAAAFVREIARESGGNPTIRQTVWDKNMANGDPAEGLLQFIPSTFMSYAVPGHTNILNGEDQIMATINAYMHSGAWGNIGTGEQIDFLANGGLVNRPLSAIIGEDGPETVLPLGAAKASRAWQLLGQAVTNINQNLGASSNNNGQSDSDVGSKLDAIISLLTLAVESGQSDNTSGASNSSMLRNLAKLLAPYQQQQMNNQKLRGGVII
ncbi:tape measure protein [Schleiferilactobacillus harbinensis]|uniref:Minor tail protein n=1 Tax=Schleiferilactobacillus harbinensis DSM 16991 TaxID=1122147 RepID=A0A0R1X7C3_9LACO|nr:tape measure protein [Schleiferilactobacillus harbinensis]KRM23753.1 minor tail protein [Schleiferilactobacillus harbinensis DSM 16991]QFR64570.1 tape measure protein [Schleiferilactobacillus harbinensis]